MTVTIVLDDIPQPLNQNAVTKLHWSRIRERARTIRHHGYIMWRSSGAPKLDRAQVDVYLQFRDSRIRDVENYAPTWKHALDGMVKGPNEKAPLRGVLPGDDPRYVTGPFPHLVGEPDRALRGLRLTLLFTPR